MSKLKVVFHKLTHWEHWPSYMFYIPNLPFSFYLALKARSTVFYTAVNPAIKNSGDGMESKFDTIQLIPEQYRPKSVFIKIGESFEFCLNKIVESNIDFPLIAKPDVGFRGALVTKINSKKELENYLNKYQINILIQEFVDYSNECGIMYYCMPNETSGTISSITLKKFLSVKGDGISSLSDLILKDNRAYIYYDILKKIHGDNLKSTPSDGDIITLTVIGNHSKGTQFLDGNHLICEKLTKMIDTINQQIPGWFYGRLDIKYNSFDKLLKGIDFKILEINGIISEPTHIYDASKNSYLDAVKSIGHHWHTIYKIGTLNHKQNQVPYTRASTFIKQMIALRRYSKKLNKLRLQ